MPMVTLYLEDTYRLCGGGRGGASISGTTLRGAGLRPGSPTSTRVDHRLHCSSFGVPAKTIIPVNSHLGTHATSVVNSPKSKIITMTYEVYRAFLCCTPANGTVRHLFIRSTLSDHRLFTRTTGN